MDTVQIFYEFKAGIWSGVVYTRFSHGEKFSHLLSWPKTEKTLLSYILIYYQELLSSFFLLSFIFMIYSISKVYIYIYLSFMWYIACPWYIYTFSSIYYKEHKENIPFILYKQSIYVLLCIIYRPYRKYIYI